MKIHSDTITYHDIVGCVPSGCYLAGFYGRDEQHHYIDTVGSRQRARAYIVRLSGSSKYAMQGVAENDKAASWDEWGIFIAALYRLDPDAIIGHYKTFNDFIEWTTSERDRCAIYRPDLGRTAPWLDDENLIALGT